MAKNTRTAWLLRLEGSQFGPFSEQEVIKILDSGSLVGTLYASRVGSRSWFLLTEVSQILASTEVNWDEAGHITTESNASKRSDVRISLIATVSRVLPTGKQMVGVCSDISGGGMQVVNSTDSRFIIGETVELVVNPIVAAGIQPFTVTAKVAWVKAALKKVGFQFIGFDGNLSLQRYIEANKQGLEQFQF